MQLISPAEIAADRADANDNMPDRIRVTKPGVGKGPWDEDSMTYDPPDRVLVYEGRARLQVKADINSNVVETTAGEREWTYLTATIQVPIEPTDDPAELGSTAAIRNDDVAELLSCPNDPALVGRLFNVQGTLHKSMASHRRLRIREVTS